MHPTAVTVLMCIVFGVADGSFQSRLYRLHDVKHWPFGDAPIATHSVKNILTCARFCMLQQDCTSFVTNCTAGQWGEEADCHLTNLTTINPAAQGFSGLCWGTDPQTTVNSVAPTAVTTGSLLTTMASATPSTTQSATPSTALLLQLLDIVWGVRDICFSGSNEDILAFTDAGIYVYDVDILTSPCKGPVTLTDMLPGYTTLPAPSDVKAVVLYQTSVLELYTASAVYQWQSVGGVTPLQNNNMYTSQPINSFLGLSSGAYYIFNWGCYRDYNSWERQFFMDDGSFRAVYNGATSVYNQSDSVLVMNGYDYNPWGDIPSNTVALTGYGSQYSNNFILVTSDLKVYTYVLNYSGMVLGSKTLTFIGNMPFV